MRTGRSTGNTALVLADIQIEPGRARADRPGEPTDIRPTNIRRLAITSRTNGTRTAGAQAP